MYRTILVPLDGSEVADSILAQVARLTRMYQARLLLLTVGQALPVDSEAATGTRLPSTFEAEAYLQRLCSSLRAEGLQVSMLTCIGEAACEILEVARRHQVDLIVINSRGGGGAPLPFLGSVAEKVASTSTVPVLVLRDAADDHTTRMRSREIPNTAQP